MSGLKEKAVKSVAWVGSTRLIGQAFSWIVTIILVRILAPEDFGAMGMLMAYQSIIIIIYDLSLGEAIIQKEHLTDEDTNTCFWFTICFGFTLMLITWVIAPLVANFFRNNQLIWMLRISSLGIFCLSVKEIHTVLLRRNLDFDKRSKAQLFSGIISLLVSLVMALLGYGVWSLVFGLLANHFFHTLFVLYYIRWKPEFYFSLETLLDMFRFAAPMFSSNLLDYFFKNSDSIIIGRGLGAYSLGFYRVAMDLSRIPIDKFISIINQVCFPVFSKLQNDTNNLRSYFLKVVKHITLLTFPMFTGMFLVSKEIIYLILSPKWIPALNLLRIFCFLAIFQSLTGIFVVLLKAKGMVWVIFRFTLLNSILLPSLFLIALPFGLEAIAYCWLIVFPVLFLYLLYHVYKGLQLSMTMLIKNILPAFSATVSMAIVVAFVKATLQTADSSWLFFVISVTSGIISYLCCFVIFYKDIVRDSISLMRTAFAKDNIKLNNVSMDEKNDKH